MSENKAESGTATQSAYQKLLDDLPRTGPGTRGGEMLRRYWHPVCLSANLPDIPLAVRILSEDLVAFRDGKGRPGLLGIRCSHRLASLEYGQVRERGALAGVPIAGILGDQQAALVGQTCFTPGEAKNTYGTGCFLLQNIGSSPIRSRQQLVTTVAWQVGGRTEYALEGSVFIGGAVVQWIRDGLGFVRTAADIEPLAASVADNGGVYLVPAFAGLGAPHWDPYARGTIVGITRGTTAAHIARAALESIAYQVSDLLDAMAADAGIPLTELRVDGGAATNNTLMQFQADLLGVPVVRPVVTETTALGAAYLAGLAVGFWPSLDAISGQWQVDRRFEPAMPRSATAALRGQWTEALQRSKGWIKQA